MWNNNVRYAQDFNWHTVINNDSSSWKHRRKLWGNDHTAWQILTVLTHLGKCLVFQLSRRLPLPQLPWPDPPHLLSPRLRQHRSTSGVDYCVSTAVVPWRADFYHVYNDPTAKSTNTEKTSIDIGLLHVTYAVFSRNKVLFNVTLTSFHPKWYKRRPEPSNLVKLSQLCWNFIFQTWRSWVSPNPEPEIEQCDGKVHKLDMSGQQIAKEKEARNVNQ